MVGYLVWTFMGFSLADRDLQRESPFNTASAFFRVDPPVIERAPRDRAFELAASGMGRRTMSAMEARPPEAMTGIETTPRPCRWWLPS